MKSMAFTINKMFISLRFKYIHSFWYLPSYTLDHFLSLNKAGKFPWSGNGSGQNLAQHHEASPNPYHGLSRGQAGQFPPWDTMSQRRVRWVGTHTWGGTVGPHRSVPPACRYGGAGLPPLGTSCRRCLEMWGVLLTFHKRLALGYVRRVTGIDPECKLITSHQ